MKALAFAIALFAATAAQADLFDRFTDVPLGDGARIAFAASSQSPEIVAIDIDKQAIAATLDLPFIPGAIAVSDTFDLLFAADPGSKSVGVVFLPTRDFAATNLIGMTPDVALIDPNDNFIAYGGREGVISIWDIENNRELRRIEGLEPVKTLTFGRNGVYLYSVEAAKMRVAVIDVVAGEVVTHIPLPGSPGPQAQATGLSRSLDGGTGIVSLPADNKLAILDLVAFEPFRTLDVAPDPGRPYASGDGLLFLIPHGAGKAVTVISGETLTPLRTIETGYPVADVLTGWLDTVAYALPEEGETVQAIDLGTLEPGARFDLGGTPGSGIVNSDTRLLVTTLPGSGKIALIDAGGQRISKTLKTKLDGLQAPAMAVTSNICH